jgi:hypothetical protein
VLTAQLFVGDVGLSQDASTADDGNVTLGGVWRPAVSWVSSEAPAWRLTGSVSIPTWLDDALAAGDVYVLLSGADGTPIARAQLGRVDEAHGGTIGSGNEPGNYTGLAVFFVDTQRNTTQYWIYYTTPLSYVERGASVRLATVTADDAIPMILGDDARVLACVLH